MSTCHWSFFFELGHRAALGHDVSVFRCRGVHEKIVFLDHRETVRPAFGHSVAVKTVRSPHTTITAARVDSVQPLPRAAGKLFCFEVDTTHWSSLPTDRHDAEATEPRPVSLASSQSGGNDDVGANDNKHSFNVVLVASVLAPGGEQAMKAAGVLLSSLLVGLPPIFGRPVATSTSTWSWYVLARTIVQWCVCGRTRQAQTHADLWMALFPQACVVCGSAGAN